MDSEVATNQPSRWPGVIFSLFIPGFGLFRGRQFRRGIAWLLGIQILGLIAALLLAYELIPMAVGFMALIFCLLLVLQMLRESYCPGKMTPKLWGLFFALFFALTFLPPPGSFLARQFKTPSSSMEPTLIGKRDGNTPDHIVVDKFTYFFTSPKRGDLIVFKTSGITGIPRYPNTGEVFYVKRLVGLPGERIEIKKGSVFAEGKPLSESDGIPPIQYKDFENTAPTVKKENGVYIVGDSEYFVLGDNPPNSADSRLWGCVPESAVIGKVTKIYFPFERMGRPHFESSEKRL